jgi:hypothetical protein
VNRFVKALGEIIVGDVTVHLATDNALELFATIEEREYLGYNGSLGTKGYDPSVLERYRIVEDPKIVTPVVPAESDGETVCLHEEIEAFEDDPTHGACNACLAEFEMRGDGRPRRPVPESESPLDDAGDGDAAP